MVRRTLHWDGCVNVRDLGGLPTGDGRRTRWGAVVRADNPARLTTVGWRALENHGIRTIVSLRTDGLDDDGVLEDHASPRPEHLQAVRVAIEDFTDADFVSRWVDTSLWLTPLYYADALRRWPERHAAAVAAVADAAPGGVLIHCGRGHDRTGIVSLLLLALAGVGPEHIAADYAMSDPNMPTEERRAFREALARERTTAEESIRVTLSGLDVVRYLRESGLDDRTIEAVRERLVEPVGT